MAGHGRIMLRRGLTALPALAAVAGLAACSSSTPARQAAPPVSPAPTAAPPSGPAPTAAPPSAVPPSATSPSAIPSSAAPGTPAAVGPCASAQLSVSLGQADGAAGTSYTPLIFTNTSGSTCTLNGHPGVSYVTGDTGQQVGAPAVREGSGTTVLLRPGAQANSRLSSVNVESTPCDRQPVSGFRIYPPDQTAALFLPSRQPGGVVCANATRLTIGPVQAGVSLS